MVIDFNKILKKYFNKKRDAIIYQISEDAVELTLIRQEDTDTGVCLINTIYTKRVPIILKNKKALDETAGIIQKLTDDTMITREVAEGEFDKTFSRVVCIFNEPISLKADNKYKKSFPELTKITKSVIKDVLNEQNLVDSNLDSADKNLAVYNSEITKATLNGYDTHKPLNKYAKRIELIESKYLILPQVWEATASIIERSFNRDVRYIHTTKGVRVDTLEFCDKIYTVTELQELSHDIL